MDKVAANNYLTRLRKAIKLASSMVQGNLLRKIAKLKKELEKLEAPKEVEKVNAKIERIYGEYKLSKTLDSYTISKQVTFKPDFKYWEKLVFQTNASPEERLTAMIVIKNKVQKEVSKFRDDHKDCDEWFSEYIEFREKSRELKQLPKHKFERKKQLERPNKEHSNLRDNRIKNKKPHQTNKRQSDNNQTNFHYNNDDNKPKSNNNINNNDNDDEVSHPSWKVKRKEKELLKAALAGQLRPQKRIVYNDGDD